ncbi:MAG: 1-acyl-sn-glycerol-3-phosphate acyltransferase [Clostridiales bacterium]|nr:1-acyl-sn-glycerol-3-phosphate acyltransferase [Clostridiales bacterium]
MNGWYKFLYVFLYPLAKLLFPCKVMDRYKYKKYDRGQIILTNHLSWMDILYVFFGLPNGLKRALSKKENKGGKFQTWLMKTIGVIFVDREKPELSSMRECINALKGGDTLVIAPEGTRNRVNRELQPLHSGAAMFALKGNARVVPYVIHHKGKLFHRNYVAVGDPVDLSDLFDKRVDEPALNEATERFRTGMQKTLDKLDNWVLEKGWKKEKKKLKAEKKQNKILSAQYKKAKKAAYAKGNCSK